MRDKSISALVIKSVCLFAAPTFAWHVDPAHELNIVLDCLCGLNLYLFNRYVVFGTFENCDDCGTSRQLD